ncbi:MAG: sugar phosphate nucleotidyltransferase [Planctomycetaceae bacterium]
MPIQFSESHWKTCWAHRRQVESQIRCTILAAGLGRRLEPLTVRYIPKPLFPLGGKVPMVETWVRKMVDSGLFDISMNLCVLKQTIKRHFGDGAKFGAQINFVEEDVPSGTLGGVCKQTLGRKAKVLPGELPLEIEPFRGSTVIVPSGDIVTNVGAELLQELYDIHKQAGASLTMALVPVPLDRRKDFGTAVLSSPQERNSILGRSGRISQFHEKDPNSPSNLNNASIYIIESRLLNELDPLRTEANLEVDEPFYDFGKHVFPALLGKLPYVKLSPDNLLWGVQYDGEWFDVGRKRDDLRVNEHLLDGALDLNLPFEKLPWGYLGTDVAIDFGRVTIIPPVVIGSHCTIEPGATLGPYAVIGDDWTIEKNATVNHSVLWERYPMVRDDGSQVTSSEMRLIDRHEVRAGVSVVESIVASGAIEFDVSASTVEVLEDGRLNVSSIDDEPQAARA